jgi:hypothetical protein
VARSSIARKKKVTINPPRFNASTGTKCVVTFADARAVTIVPVVPSRRVS